MSVYHIVLRKLINGQSVNSIRVVKAGTKADIKVELPNEVQLSATPLGGHFRVKCTDPQGYVSYSHDLWRGSNWLNVKTAINEGCDRLYDLTEIYDTVDFPYQENGRAWLIRFIGLNADPGQFEIVEGKDKPIVGNITYYSNTTVPYSSNLFYEPVPFEMLRTYETKP